jgi:manganese-dependent inorganic pyrophosphatase
MIIVIGHNNPDTDSVVAAKVLASLLKRSGQDVFARIADDVNRETEFIFKELGEEIPKKIKQDEMKEKSFFLVDHNDISQSVASKEDVVGVLDHHLLSGMRTDKAIFFRVEPIGSTATLVYKMFKERNVEIEREEGGLLLAGIISDTLNLTSSTTTSEDIDAYYELAELTGVDANNFAEKMFTAKSDFSGKTTEEIITGDMKIYDFEGQKVAVGVSETTSLQYFEENNEEIKKVVKKVKEKEGFNAFFFGAVDIVRQNTYFYPGGNSEAQVIEDIFGGEKKEGVFLLEGVSSRKSQILPPLSKYYGKN